MFNQHFKHYHQWLHTANPFKTKSGHIPYDSTEYKTGKKDKPLATCIQSLLSKNAIKRVENIESLGFYCCLFLVPKPHQRWRPVIDLSKLNTFLHVEKFKMEPPESIICLPSHPHPSKLKEIPRFCHRLQVFQFHLIPFGLARASRVLTMIVKEVKLMALSRGLRLHQYLDDWLIRSQSHEEAQVSTHTVIDLTQSLGRIKIRKKLKPTQVFSFVGYEYHLDSALVKPT